jgi:hypothetical protein
MVTPLRIYIVCVLILTLFILVSPLNSEGNWALGVFLIPLYTLIPAIMIEIVLTIVRPRITENLHTLFSIFGVLISIIGPLKFISWMS